MKVSKLYVVCNLFKLYYFKNECIYHITEIIFFFSTIMIISNFLMLLRSTQHQMFIPFMGVLIVLSHLTKGIVCWYLFIDIFFRKTSDLDIPAQDTEYIQIYKPPPPYPISNSTPDLARACPLRYMQNAVSLFHLHYYIYIYIILYMFQLISYFFYFYYLIILHSYYLHKV